MSNPDMNTPSKAISAANRPYVVAYRYGHPGRTLVAAMIERKTKPVVQISMNTNTDSFTREQYMNHDCTHRQYFGQFVTPEIKNMVLQRFGLPTLLRSTDEHLNDIPLAQWDALAGCRMRGSELIGRPNPRIEDGSLSSTVCTFKEAAKQLIEENR